MLNNLMSQVERLVASLERMSLALEKMAIREINGTPVDPQPTAPKQTRGRKPSSAPETKDTPTSTAESAAPSTTPAATSAPVVETPTPAPVPEEEDDFGGESKTYTVDEVRAALVKLAGAKGEEAAKKIVKEVGNSPNVKSMLPEKYAGVMSAIMEAMK